MTSPTLPSPGPAGLNEALLRNIDAMERRRATARADATREDRIAQAITRFTGSMTFVYLHLAVYGAWLVVNLGAVPSIAPFDPSFVILASEASVEAIFLSTFVLISQNRMTAAADERADLDLHINLLAEHEITRIAAAVQAIVDHLGIERPAEMEEITRNVAPEAVLDEIAHRQSDTD